MPSWSKKPKAGEKKKPNEKPEKKKGSCGACGGSGSIPLDDPDDGSSVHYPCSSCRGT